MFVLAAHILKLEGYKENFHGPLHKDDTLICEFMHISVLNGCKVSAEENENVLEMDDSDSCTAMSVSLMQPN